MNYSVITALKNNKGFTMLSMLIVLMIILMTFPFVSYLLKNSTLIGQYDDISVQQFFIFIEKDIFAAKDANINGDELLLINKNNDIAIYKLVNHTIRRQLNGGQEFYLRNVEKFDLQSLPYGCKLIVTTKKGGVYEKSFEFIEK